MFQNLWIERTTYTTEFELPGILKWFEVVDQRMEQLCPPQYACETVDRHNKQLRQIIIHYRANPQVFALLFDIFDLYYSNFLIVETFLLLIEW